MLELIILFIVLASFILGSWWGYNSGFHAGWMSRMNEEIEEFNKHLDSKIKNL